MTVGRLGHEPRPTAPYTEEVWQALCEGGDRADAALRERGVKLTIGGEPTFNAREHAELPEWNGEALGETQVEARGEARRGAPAAAGAWGGPAAARRQALPGREPAALGARHLRAARPGAALDGRDGGLGRQCGRRRRRARWRKRWPRGWAWRRTCSPPTRIRGASSRTRRTCRSTSIRSPPTSTTPRSGGAWRGCWARGSARRWASCCRSREAPTGAG